MTKQIFFTIKHSIMAKQKLFTEEMGKNVFVFPSNHSDADVKKSVYSPKIYSTGRLNKRGSNRGALKIR